MGACIYAAASGAAAYAGMLMFPDTGVLNLSRVISTILVPTSKNTDVVLHKGNVARAGQRIAETGSRGIQGFRAPVVHQSLSN